MSLSTRNTLKTLEQATSKHASAGFTLVELLISMVIGAIVLIGLLSAVTESLHSDFVVQQRIGLARQADFAMQRLSNAVGKTQYLMLPLVDNPNTTWDESTRDVLATTLDPTLDRDGDGWADANNDKDFQDSNQNGIRDDGESERIDEDSHSDMTNDGKSGIIGIDDDGDGSIDEDHKDDDDEDGTKNEEEDGDFDLDADSSIGEDKHQQMVHDDMPGLSGVDDDGDGVIDEGDKNDDDEDGQKNEDWLDPVVFYLNGNDLIERTPTIDPADGTEYLENIIANQVSHFEVSRLPIGSGRATLVSIELTITAADGESFSLSTTIAVGDFL